LEPQRHGEHRGLLFFDSSTAGGNTIFPEKDLTSGLAHQLQRAGAQERHQAPGTVESSIIIWSNKG
jgi:hypothetical protein